MYAIEALAMIVFNQPERRAEIIELLQKLLNSMVSRLPNQDACDGHFAGNLMCTLLDISAKELQTEVEAVFATDCVDKSSAGDCKKVVKLLNSEPDQYIIDNYRMPDKYTQFEQFESANLRND